MSEWENPEHAWRAGLLLGHLMRNGVEAIPVMNGRDFTNHIDIPVELDAYVRTVETGGPLFIRIKVLP